VLKRQQRHDLSPMQTLNALAEDRNVWGGGVLQGGTEVEREGGTEGGTGLSM